MSLSFALRRLRAASRAWDGVRAGADMAGGQSEFRGVLMCAVFDGYSQALPESLGRSKCGPRRVKECKLSRLSKESQVASRAGPFSGDTDSRKGF